MTEEESEIFINIIELLKGAENKQCLLELLGNDFKYLYYNEEHYKLE